MFSYSFQSEVSSRRARPEEPLSSLNSLSHSDSLSFRRPNHRYQASHVAPVSIFSIISGKEEFKGNLFFVPVLSGADSSSHHSLSHVSSDHRGRTKKDAVEGKRRKGGAEERTEREAGSSSIEEEVLTAANESLCSDSIPSVVDEKGINTQSTSCHHLIYTSTKTVYAVYPHMAPKNLIFGSPGDSTSVATEYSLKFDESMTEDEIEERSFRSLLPSEAHRRGTKEKKPRHHEESEDDGTNHNTTLISGAHNILKVRGQFSHINICQCQWLTVVGGCDH